MMYSRNEDLVPIRITLIGLPVGVQFRVQSKNGLIEPVIVSENSISFDLSVRIRKTNDSIPNFLGPFVNGPPADRFIYINSGTLAGQEDSCFTRRAKVRLSGITVGQIKEVSNDGEKRLVATISGLARDGGPACAVVPLLDNGWRVI